MNPIILFDGYCKLCNSTVNIIIKNDKHKKFRFAALQSKKGKELLSKEERCQFIELQHLYIIDDILETLTPRNEKHRSFSELKSDFETQFENFELFWFSKPMETLRDHGLLVL